MQIDFEKEQIAAELKGSLLEFTKTFYPLLSGRQFIISYPPGRESHQITISKALTKAFNLNLPSQRLLINVSPGSGKSTLVSFWIAWAMAQYPDSQFLYVSYSKSLAAKHTETIKRIIQLPHYKYLFDVKIRHDSKAKEYFQTTAGGAVAAVGSSGTVTGLNSGVPGVNRFSGCMIIDDPIKPDEAHSDTIRQSVIENYRETLQQRARSEKVPFIFIGQRVHEADLAAYLIEGNDGYNWEKVILKSIDEAGNPMYPEVNSLEMLRIKQERDPYVFASQFQQDPIPAGGALFKKDWFTILPEEPKILFTFMVADTAESDKSYNDATAFSFWGVYEIENAGQKTGQYGLHWLNAWEIRVEPKDLKDEFISFYADCMLHPIKPLVAAIEKKSTGVTLISTLQDIRGLQIMDVKRTKASGSKTQRFLEMQPIIASKLISFTEGARHANMCIEHMSKITANNTHKHDDLADNLYDACKMALIDKTLIRKEIDPVDYSQIAKNITSFGQRLDRIKGRAYGK